MANQHVLILGGARSGKTGFAEKLAARIGERPAYLATAQPYDAEMHERIKAHRNTRQGKFTTVEEPLELSQTILDISAEHDVVLVDCLTLWITNLLGTGADVATHVGELAATLSQLTRSRIILVSNEVGLGIVPDNPMARSFRDLAGTAHQTLAELCDDVYFVAAGLPMTLKGATPV